MDIEQEFVRTKHRTAPGREGAIRGIVAPANKLLPDAEMIEDRINLRRHGLTDSRFAGFGRVDQPDAQFRRKTSERQGRRASGGSRPGDQNVEISQDLSGLL